MKVKCPECEKLCDEKHGLKSHVWRMHGPGKGTFDPNIGFVYGTRQIWNKGSRAETPDQIPVKGHQKTRLREALIEIGRERENLRFLCLNCHSQTDTFGMRNVKKRRLAGTEHSISG